MTCPNKLVFCQAECLCLSVLQLTGLEALNLDDCELAEFPHLAPLTRLTSLGLSNCFDGRPWGRLAWESRLSGLSSLQQLAVLNLSGNSLLVVSSAISYLPRLIKLKVGLNPLTDGEELGAAGLLMCSHPLGCERIPR